MPLFVCNFSVYTENFGFLDVQNFVRLLQLYVSCQSQLSTESEQEAKLSPRNCSTRLFSWGRSRPLSSTSFSQDSVDLDFDLDLDLDPNSNMDSDVDSYYLYLDTGCEPH